MNNELVANRVDENPNEYIKRYRLAQKKERITDVVSALMTGRIKRLKVLCINCL